MEKQIIDLPRTLAMIKEGNYHKVIVTGPQRSGTHIAAKIIANMLSYNYIEEDDFGINSFEKFKQRYTNILHIVVQAPGIAHKIHHLDQSWFIVFMYRDVVEIIASEKRIGWKDEHIEKNKYISEFNLAGKFPHMKICVLKYLCFSTYQYQHIGDRTAKLSYASLANHKLWIDKKDRPKKLYK